MTAFFKAIWPYALAATTGFALAWFWQANSYGAQISTLQAAHATAMKAISDAAAEASEKARVKETLWRSDIAAIEAQHEKEITDAKSENDRLAADVAAGARRLSVRAHCPASGGGVPQDSGATASGDETTVELSQSSRQAYYDLRAAITQDHVTLGACQAYAISVSK